MDKTVAKEVVDVLIRKAERAHDSVDAIRLSQSAVNVANAYCSLARINHD
jgi:hypothetical protein